MSKELSNVSTETSTEDLEQYTQMEDLVISGLDTKQTKHTPGWWLPSDCGLLTCNLR